MNLILEYTRKYAASFILSFVLVSIVIFSLLIQPDILSKILTAIVKMDTSSITGLGMTLVLFAILGLVIGIVNTVIAARIAQKTGSDLRTRIFNKIQTFSYSNIEKFQAGNLVVRLVNDTQQVQNLIMIILQSLTRIPVLAVGSFILAIIALPQLWWVVILAVVLVFVSMGIGFGLMGPKFVKMQHLIERINALAKENFMGMRVVKSFVQETSEIDKFNGVSEQLTKEIIGLGYIFSFLIPIFFLILDSTVALVVLLVGRMADLNPAVIGQAVAFISYLANTMMALMIGGMMVSFSSRALVSVGRINEVLNTDTDMTFAHSSAPITKGSIRFVNVSFKYDGSDQETLQHINFSVEHGQTLGVVGATGSGKSTLAQLIARIFDPNEGQIFIDNQDVRKISRDVLHQEVSLVLQRPVIFSGTIAETIRQGKADASRDELLKAATIAQAYEFIEKEPDRFDAEVYQRGANFSGGQKQRLSIARGVVNNPKILILDDSTSALDAQSEKRVKEALKTSMPDTTKVIVAQKISSIVHADVILVLDEGRVVGTGTHQSLLEHSDIYREIFETQKGRGVVSALDDNEREGFES